MADMDQKDRCSCIYMAGIAGYFAPRAVFPSLVGRPRMLGILFGTDLKYSCSGMCKAGFSGFLHLALCCLRCTGKLDFWRWRLFFSGSLYLEVICSSCLPEEYRVADFSGRSSRNGFSIQHSSWFNSGYMFGISLPGLFWKNYPFYVKGGLSDPEVDPRPSQIPMVVEFLQLQYIDKMFDVRCAGPASSGSARENTVEFPQLQPVSWTWSFTRPLCATTDAHGR